jgi:hypothetical protein
MESDQFHAVDRISDVAQEAHPDENSACAPAALLTAVAASSGPSLADGETIVYSAPFLFAQFEVILQDQTATNGQGGRADRAGADQRRRRLPRKHRHHRLWRNLIAQAPKA